MAAAAVAFRLRNVSRSTLGTNNPDSLLLCNALHTKSFSSSSNNNRNDSGGFPSLDDFKKSLKTVKPDAQYQTNYSQVENDNKFRYSNFEDARASRRNLNPQREQSQAIFGIAPRDPPFEEIRKNLSEFRRKSEPPAGRNFDAGRPSPDNDGKDRISYDYIRDSLRKLGSSSPEKSKVNSNESLASFSLTAFGRSLKLQPDGIGEEGGQRSDSKSSPVFGRNVRQKAAVEARNSETEFVKMYSYDELGKKLRKLRPEAEKDEEQEKKKFSLTELNERLQKLREMEKKELSIGGISFTDIRESLFQLSRAKENSSKSSSWQRASLLGQLGGQTIPNYMTSPPKDDLLERYFHPDNMSAEEKMKIELKKVREDFKKHEADCGSSSVQVAQLTAKIKYLGKALRKKDKHSRKGLQGMIQKRKKLLKYLRRTDWDSYCSVLSKLGLRDNPDYKT